MPRGKVGTSILAPGKLICTPEPSSLPPGGRKLGVSEDKTTGGRMPRRELSHIKRGVSRQEDGRPLPGDSLSACQLALVTLGTALSQVGVEDSRVSMWKRIHVSLLTNPLPCFFLLVS